MVITLVIFGIVFGILFALFLRIIRIKADIEVRQTLIKTTYDVMEQLNTKLKDYTIDYEEYFNRDMVWCATATWWEMAKDAFGEWEQGNNFVWNTTKNGQKIGHCSQRTQYGNAASLLDSYTYISTGWQHRLYACSSDSTMGDIAGPNSIGKPNEERLLVKVNSSSSCADNLFTNGFQDNNNFLTTPFVQPYGAYKVQFFDVKADVDDKYGRAGDDDDTDLGKWPDAIVDASHAQELYLISKDKKKRILFRRALIASWDWNGNGVISGDNETLYTLQMLQLKAFDAGDNHDFDSQTYSGVYDGVIDTRACDAEAWYICHGASLWWVYSLYHLPADGDDGWVNIMSNDITLTKWNLNILPTKDPDLSWGDRRYQINPFVTVYLDSTVYGKNWVSRLGTENLDDISFDIQSSFDVKTNY